MNRKESFTSPQDVLYQAMRLEDSRDLEGAYRLYLTAADGFENLLGSASNAEGFQPYDHEVFATNISSYLDDACFALMRAGQCLEMLQPWRSHTAVWERLGNMLGNAAESIPKFRTPHAPGQHRMYHIISYEEWRSGLVDGTPENEKEAWRAEQQALAYTWGAEEADSNARYILAARLYRKAGTVWVQNGARLHDRVGAEVLGERDPSRRHLSEPEGYSKEAARCFYRGALCALLSTDAQMIARVSEPWTAEENEWGRTASEELPSQKNGLSDLERMRLCWSDYLDLPNRKVRTPKSVDRGRVEGFEDYARQLSDIQREYARLGERRTAVRVYRHRQSILGYRDIAAGRRGRAMARFVSRILTGNSSSVNRALATVMVLYVILFPLAYLFLWRFDIVGTTLVPRVFDSIVFSLDNVVSLSSTRYVTNGFPVSVLQATQGLSGYAALGYILWLALRSYEQ